MSVRLTLSFLLHFLFLSFAPAVLYADNQPAESDVQQEVTQLRDNHIVLVQRSDLLEDGKACLIDRNTVLEFEIGKTQLARDQLSQQMAGLKAEAEHYAQRSRELEAVIEKNRAEIRMIQSKRQEVLDIFPCSILGFLCEAAFDLASKISGLEAEINRAVTEAHNANLELQTTRQNYDQSANAYRQAETKLAALQTQSKQLSDDMKQSKQLLSDTNTLTFELLSTLDQIEELNTTSPSKKISKQRLDEIIDLNKRATETVLKVDDFLTEHSCIA